MQRVFHLSKVVLNPKGNCYISHKYNGKVYVNNFSDTPYDATWDVTRCHMYIYGDIEKVCLLHNHIVI